MLLEDLESRLLLTAILTGVAKPEFMIEHLVSVRSDASFAPDGLTPSLIRQAYGVNQAMFGSVTGDGSGQTIAIIDAYNAPTITTDLHTFDSLYGLPDPTLVRINQNGGTSLPGDDPSGRGDSWAVETSLDVEWAHAIAPKAKIVLVEASSDDDSDLYAAINTARNYTGVSVVSMSWGGDESSTDPSFNSDFTTPSGHTGITFLASSGDSGAYGSTGTKKVGYPAASPNVVAVGGTTLTIDSSGDYVSESGWGSGTNSFRNGGSGGGISTIEAQPPYQNGIVTQSTTKRALPDVSFDADPNSGVAVIDSWDFGNSTPVPIGGTSLASPVWAAIIAIADQGRALAGLGTLDGATQTLPKLYALPSSDFHDITTGNNGYAAGPGFDLVTGLGTPIVNKVVADLVGTTAPTKGVPDIATFTTAPSAVVSGTTVLLAANVTETGGTVSSVKFYRESNGTSGLQTSSDTLVGTGIKSGSTWSLAISTAGLASGSYTYYAVATDTASVTATSSATLSIVAPTIGSFTGNPGSVLAGTAVTLTASSVAETAGGTVASVQFYAESNGTSGLQTSSDTLLSAGVQNGTTWTTSLDTTGFAPGTYTYYTIATDAAGITSTVATTTITVLAPASGNDLFAAGTVITGTSISVNGSNLNATREPGEPNHAGNSGGHSVWWTWTAPSSGLVTIDTHGSNFDTLLAVYTGTSVSSLTRVASNDDDTANRTLTSRVTFNAVAGVTYHIAVDGYDGAQGTIQLHLQEALPPANDNFANAVALTENSASWSGTNIGATKETGEPTLVAGNAGGASVWVTWTPTNSELATISTYGSNFDTLLGIYTGSSLGALSLVASDDDNFAMRSLTSVVTFNAQAGVTYHILIDGYDAAQGNIVLTIS